jgi:hypothetical protein
MVGVPVSDAPHRAESIEHCVHPLPNLPPRGGGDGRGALRSLTNLRYNIPS